MPSPRPSNEDRIRAALWFADRGFGVFSVWSADDDGTCRCAAKRACGSPGKHPIGNQGFHDATLDPARIRTMLSAASEPNYGLVCPDGVFVLDVDGDGVARLAELEAKHGPLPPTLRTNTAHGQHVFLRWPDGHPRPIGQMFGYVTRWGSGSGAGYVIGPRSVHPSGAVYAPAGKFLEIAEMPEAWALDLVAPRREGLVIEVHGGGYELPDHGYDGARYDAIRDYAASRYTRGLSEDEVWAGVRDVLAPRFASPLGEAELRDRFTRSWRDLPKRFGPPAMSGASAFVPVEPAGPQVVDSWPSPPGPAAYRGPAGEAVLAVVDHTEADPVGVLGSLLASLGACMGLHRYMYQGSYQASNLFVVLVGDSSTGRKGTAGSVAKVVLDDAYPDWSRLIVAGLGSGEGLVAHLKEKEKEGEHRALVMESELARLLTIVAREGSTLSPILRDAWDGVPLGRALSRDSIQVSRHHVGVLAHVTPVELRQKLTSTDAANGFGNRFVWLAVRRTRLVAFPESPRGIIPASVTDALRDAVDAAQLPAEVKWSAGARDAWEELYGRMAMTRRRGLSGAMLARREAQTVRLALLYALLDRSGSVTTGHLESAVEVWEYAERSVIHVFGESTGNRDSDQLRLMLADGPLEWEEAKRQLGVRRGADLADAVDVLVEMSLAEVVRADRKGGGRRGRLIRSMERNPANPANSAGVLRKEEAQEPA